MIGTVQTPSNPSRRRLRIAIVAVSLTAAAVGSIVLATSGAGEKTTTRGLTATLHLPDHPQFAVADRQALWVSTYGSTARPDVYATGQLLRIDLASGTVQHTVQLSGQSANLVRDGDRVIADAAIAGTSTVSAHGPGELIAVDWRTGDVLARRRQQIATGPMAIGDGSLWAIQEKPSMLLKLSPTTLAPIAPPLALTRTSNVFGLAFGGGYLWASAGDDGDVLRIDPATRRITRAHVGGFPIGLVLEGGSVWVIDNDHDTVLRLDPRTLRQTGKPVHTPHGGAFYLGATDGHVFIANDTDGTITRIDARTGKTAGAPIRIAPATHSKSSSAAYAIAPAGDAIWATSDTTDTISRIEARP
jgi:streptogramin lyase